MTQLTRQAVASMRACARRNLVAARHEKSQGNLRMLQYRFRLALQCRRDANHLRHENR